MLVRRGGEWFSCSQGPRDFLMESTRVLCHLNTPAPRTIHLGPRIGARAVCLSVCVCVGGGMWLALTRVSVCSALHRPPATLSQAGLEPTMENIGTETPLPALAGHTQAVQQELAGDKNVDLAMRLWGIRWLRACTPRAPRLRPSRACPGARGTRLSWLAIAAPRDRLVCTKARTRFAATRGLPHVLIRAWGSFGKCPIPRQAWRLPTLTPTSAWTAGPSGRS